MFCLIIHHLVQQLKSEFSTWYLDDGTIGGSSDEVLDDLCKVEYMAAGLGLCLNKRKSEIICKDSSILESFLAKFPDLTVITPDKTFLLGAPLGNEVNVSEAIQERSQCCKLWETDYSISTCIMPSYYYATPLQCPGHFIYSALPRFFSPALSEYDSVLTSATSSVINVNLQDDNSAWLKASLPVNLGGLGIWSVGQLAPSAFLASAAASSSLADLILPS